VSDSYAKLVKDIFSNSYSVVTPSSFKYEIDQVTCGQFSMLCLFGAGVCVLQSTSVLFVCTHVRVGKWCGNKEWVWCRCFISASTDRLMQL